MGDNIRDENQFACQTCNRKFKTALGVRSHSRIHNKAKTQSHVCQNCNAVFNQKKGLTNHSANGNCHKPSGKPWPCSACSRTFTDLPSLKIHFDSHPPNDTENQLLDCTINEQNYSLLDVTLLGNEGTLGSSSLNKSKNSGKRKAFSCHLCDKSFKNRFSLSVHVQVHFAKKNELFSCKTCKVTFREHIALRKHLRTLDHERVKMKELGKISPMADCYECAICNKEFQDKDELFKHSSTHSTIFSDVKCDLCGKTFKLPRLMQAHLNSKGHQLMKKNQEHGIAKTQYPCLICNKLFTHKTSLKAHLRNHVETPKI